ncbi:MAG: DNA polymerase III subunit alpha [Holosporales bacterium]|jgi:DNA polymerase-3 subunit alpha|nr:DNA polymerase III subunit alpha [Holosporales bacterium]
MTSQSFIHLRVHSAYSLCESAVRIPDLVNACKNNDIPAIAVTDTNNMFGALEFSMKCSSEGIQPIIGLSVDIKVEGNISPIVLIAKNETGYKNLMKLMTCFYLKNNNEEFKFISLENLRKYNEGIITLTGGAKGPAGNLFLNGSKEKSVDFLFGLQSIFQNNLYIEISRTNEPGEKNTEKFFIDFAMQNNIPLVATNEVFFIDKSTHIAHDALLCISDGTYITVKDRRKVSLEHYLKSESEMFTLFSDIKEAVLNTAVIAKRCSFMPEKRKPVFPKFTTGSDDEKETLDKQARNGLKRKLHEEIFHYKTNEKRSQKDIEEEYFARLDYELNVIKDMGFSGYFLIVSDFVRWSKLNDIPVGPGRGSGAGSLVAWCLSITDLDPIKYNLLFERFLNPERISMPDFDIDFCQEKREEVIKYVQSRYGKEKVAHIIAFGTLQARAVIRDVGRVIQMPYGKVEKISKLVPQNPVDPIDLSRAIEIEPQLRQMMNEDESVAFLINIALQLEGLYRHASTHAAGIVIGNERIDEFSPLYSDEETNLAITQFNMKFVEMTGLIKFDFLGLKTLTIIKHASEYVKKYKEIDLDITKIDLEDRKTFDLLCSSDVVGVFQLESAGMRDVIQKMQPDNLEDIIALVSLYRPGPMDNIPLYIARKHGKEPTEYLHPLLEPILKTTYGIMIYQEQVMKVAQELGGYSLSGADILRRAMGKKIKEDMMQNRVIFAEGAAKNGIKKEVSDKIFSLMEKFAGYGFNRSHAAAYAIISYQTAYLKANYRREFCIASLNADIANTDKLSVFIQDAKASGIEILPPDINKSEEYFIGENKDGIRYALGSLKGIGINVMSDIVKEREKYGPFKNIFDFFKRASSIGISSRQMETLTMAGAFDSIHKNRCQIFESIGELLKFGSNRFANQRSLFSDEISNSIEFKSTSKWDLLERLDFERRSIGFYLNFHPMDIYSEILGGFSITRSRDFRSGILNVTVAGILISKKEKLSQNKQKYAFLTMSDQDGSFEVTIFPDMYSKYKEYFTIGAALMVDANIKLESENVKLLGSAIRNIDDIIKNQKVYIYLNEHSNIDALHDTLEKVQNGNNAVSFIIRKENGRKVEIETKHKKNLSVENRKLLASIKEISLIDDK